MNDDGWFFYAMASVFEAFTDMRSAVRFLLLLAGGALIALGAIYLMTGHGPLQGLDPSSLWLGGHPHPPPASRGRSELAGDEGRNRLPPLDGEGWGGVNVDVGCGR